MLSKEDTENIENNECHNKLNIMNFFIAHKNTGINPGYKWSYKTLEIYLMEEYGEYSDVANMIYNEFMKDIKFMYVTDKFVEYLKNSYKYINGRNIIYPNEELEHQQTRTHIAFDEIYDIPDAKYKYEINVCIFPAFLNGQSQFKLRKASISINHIDENGILYNKFQYATVTINHNLLFINN